MAIDALKFNLLAQSPNMQAIASTKAVGGQASGGVPAALNFKGKSVGSNLFSGNTSGINDSLQPGDSVYTSAQAGKPAGVSRILCNA